MWSLSRVTSQRHLAQVAWLSLAWAIGNCSGLFTYITVFSCNYFSFFNSSHVCWAWSGSSLQLWQPHLSPASFLMCTWFGETQMATHPNTKLFFCKAFLQAMGKPLSTGRATQEQSVSSFSHSLLSGIFIKIINTIKNLFYISKTW